MHREHILQKSRDYYKLHRKGKARKATHASSLDIYYKKKYGIEYEDFLKLEKLQDNKCAICKEEESVVDPRLGNSRKLNVDHCHITGKVRGLLCYRCNRGLGNFKDSLERLSNAVKYIQGE